MADAKDLRIVYMGTPDFAVLPLKTLVEAGYNIVGVITSVDKPAGRGLKIHESAVKRYAVEAGLKVLQPEKLRAPEFLEELAELKPDLGIVIAFRMLPEVVWAMPKLGTFNLHASLLPQYRGAAPINWAVINGERVTGVTTFMLNHEIDKGDIIARKEIEITPEDTAGTLHDKLMEIGARLVAESVDLVSSGDFTPIGQKPIEPEELKPAPKIFKETCRIDWSLPGDAIINKIRGLSPYPAAWTEISNGTETIQMKVYSAEFESTEYEEFPGVIVSDGKNHLKIGCKDGFVSIKELQLAGKRRMGVVEFLRGFKEIEHYRFK